MAFSSLLFGGLSLWHARQGSEEDIRAFGVGVLTNFSSQIHQYLQWHQVALLRIAAFFQSIDPQTLAWFFSTLCILVLLGEQKRRTRYYFVLLFE